MVLDSGTTEGVSWPVRLIGLSYFNNNPTNHPVIIKLESDDRDWIIGFNGVHVTISKVEDGEYKLKGSLNSGQTEIISNWRFSDLDLMIEMLQNSTNFKPEYSYADIIISLGRSPTLNPTKSPTSSPTTAKPTSNPSPPPTMNGIVMFDSGTTGSKSWSGDLIRIMDYSNGNNPNNLPIVVMLETGGSSTWFIGFNGVGVTLTRANNGDQSLLGVLAEGRRAIVRNWRYSELNLVIEVSETNTSGSPHFAAVGLQFGEPQLARIYMDEAAGYNDDIEITFGHQPS